MIFRKYENLPFSGEIPVKAGFFVGEYFISIFRIHVCR